MIFFSKQISIILLFHRVAPFRDKMWDPMDTKLFESTLKYVKRNFNAISLNELLFDSPAYSAKPLAAITFDDGYRDFLDYSLPLLKKYNLPASLFVVTDCIEKNIPTWTYKVDYLFENSKKLELKNFAFPELPEEFKKSHWKNNEERINYGKRIKAIYKMDSFRKAKRNY